MNNTLSPDEARTFLEKWFDGLYHQKRPEVIEEMFAQDGIAYGLGGVEMVGPKEFKPFYEQFIAIFPSVRVKIHDVSVTGDTVASRCTCEVVNTKGNKGELDGMAFVKIRDGQMIKAWNNWDFLSLFIQMELFPKDAFEKGFRGEKIY